MARVPRTAAAVALSSTDPAVTASNVRVSRTIRTSRACGARLPHTPATYHVPGARRVHRESRAVMVRAGRAASVGVLGGQRAAGAVTTRAVAKRVDGALVVSADGSGEQQGDGEDGHRESECLQCRFERAEQRFAIEGLLGAVGQGDGAVHAAGAPAQGAGGGAELALGVGQAGGGQGQDVGPRR